MLTRKCLLAMLMLLNILMLILMLLNLDTEYMYADTDTDSCPCRKCKILQTSFSLYVDILKCYTVSVVLIQQKEIYSIKILFSFEMLFQTRVVFLLVLFFTNQRSLHGSERIFYFTQTALCTIY